MLAQNEHGNPSQDSNEDNLENETSTGNSDPSQEGDSKDPCPGCFQQGAEVDLSGIDLGVIDGIKQTLPVEIKPIKLGDSDEDTDIGFGIGDIKPVPVEIKPIKLGDSDKDTGVGFGDIKPMPVGIDPVVDNGKFEVDWTNYSNEDVIINPKPDPKPISYDSRENWANTQVTQQTTQPGNYGSAWNNVNAATTRPVSSATSRTNYGNANVKTQVDVSKTVNVKFK